jgi:hypothetical protein
VDLEYGPWFAKYRQQLNVPEVLGTAVLMIGAMLGLSVAWTAVRKLQQPKAEPISVVELPVRAEAQRRRA